MVSFRTKGSGGSPDPDATIRLPRVTGGGPAVDSLPNPSWHQGPLARTPNWAVVLPDHAAIKRRGLGGHPEGLSLF